MAGPRPRIGARERAVRLSGTIVASVGATVVIMGLGTSGARAATPTVTLPPGPLHDQQTITLSGSGFPSQSQLPTGLQIIECSDPGGVAANLPTDAASGCEGITLNPTQVNTDSNGAFHASYQILALNPQISSITCDASNFCVLWVGQDYNNAFTDGPHAFSAPFEVLPAGGSVPTTTPAPTTAATTTAQPTGTPSVAPATGNDATVDQGPILASTGLPGRTLVVVGVGGLLTLLGVAGRLLAGRRARLVRTSPTQQLFY